MPYLCCPGCRLTVYSAAGHSTVDHCPRCAARLFVGPSRGRDAARRGRDAGLLFLGPTRSLAATERALDARAGLEEVGDGPR